MITGPEVFSNTRRVCSARGRAWERRPALKAGCPQQVWASGKSTATPARFSTFTMAWPMWGKKESIRQVMKSWTVSAMLPLYGWGLYPARGRMVLGFRLRFVPGLSLARRTPRPGGLENDPRPPAEGWGCVVPGGDVEASDTAGHACETGSTPYADHRTAGCVPGAGEPSAGPLRAGPGPGPGGRRSMDFRSPRGRS